MRRRLIGSIDMYERADRDPVSLPSSVESDSAQFMRFTPSLPNLVSKSSTSKGFNASISRIIELDSDDDRKPIVSVLEGQCGEEDGPEA